MTTTPTLREALQAARDYGSATWDDWLKEKVDAALAALTQGAGAVEPVIWGVWDSQGLYAWNDDMQKAKAWCDQYNAREIDPLKPYTYAPLYTAPPAQQLQQAVARAIEECAVICEGIEDEYQRREGHKYPELKSDAQTGASDCAAAIRAKGTHQ